MSGGRRSAERAGWVLLLALALNAGTLPVASAFATSKVWSAKSAPCAVNKRPTQYRHVVWIVLENWGESVADSPEAPYLDHLAAQCALGTNDFAVAHPSLPNYLALTSGSTFGITDDGEPAAHRINSENLFSQLHGDWRALEESMPQPCDQTTSASYAARHNPAVYYRSLGSECRRNDVALKMPLDLGSAFTFITPNICDDMHSCPVATGDAWLARIVPLILASTQYRRQSLVLFITFDEDDAGPTNKVPVYVVAPSVPKDKRVQEPFTHYSLLRSTESLLHLGYLGAARHATSMLSAFNL